MYFGSIELEFEDGSGVTIAKWKVGIDCRTIRFDKIGIMVFYNAENKKKVWFVPMHRILNFDGDEL